MTSPGLREILAPYDGLIVDLWGVVHDGETLYPGVRATLEALREQQVPVVFLSNAPRVAAKAGHTLTRLGISPSDYLDLITSGQVTHDLLAQGGSARRYYYLGPSKDEDILSDLPHCTRVEHASQADLILCTGYERDGQPHDEIIPLLAQLLPCPMLCVNPDMEVVKQDGTQWLCAGAVAAQYTAMGGRVSYIGKPFPEVYAAARARLGQGRILAIGDNPATDIKGANDAGLDSLLITQGVLAARYGADITAEQAREICRIAGVTPSFVHGDFALQPAAG